MVADSEENVASALGRQVGQAATMSAVWLSSLELPQGMNSVQAKRLPPLRLDRDTILIGKIDAEPAAASQLRLSGTSSAGTLRFATMPS